MDHHLALDFLLAKKGGVCAIIKTFKHFRQQITFSSRSRDSENNPSGFYTGMGPNKILAPLQDMVPILSGGYSCHYSLTCVWDLHSKLLIKFVSAHIESIKLQMPLMEMLLV
jgi:hypothetical protein